MSGLVLGCCSGVISYSKYPLLVRCLGVNDLALFGVCTKRSTYPLALFGALC